MKSDSPEAFYQPVTPVTQGRESFESTPATSGPWSPKAQHGGPPAALLGRALEQLDEGSPRMLGRFAMDLLGPVPVGPLSVSATVLRPGRSVSLREAIVYDDQSGRAVARGQAWAFPVREGGPVNAPGPLPHSHADGYVKDAPDGWSRGYLDAIEWQWIVGSVGDPGPGTVWMRPLLPLVGGEPMSPLQRVLTCVDSASGASAVLDAAEWGFLNTELTVHLLRPAVGEWICLDAETTVGPGSVGMAVSAIYDEAGLVGRSTQALLVVPSWL